MQNRKSISSVVSSLLLCALMVAGCASRVPAESTASPDESSISVGGASASWASQARTISEAEREVDLIIYARVIQEPVTRILDFASPITDESGTPDGRTHTTTIPFADTLFEVLNTYKGSAPSQLLVMQTGGHLPDGKTAEFTDDPLYRVGEEYILFLVNISGDHVHAPDRELYTVLSPVGRYLIEGNSAKNFAEEYMNQQLPTTTEELERQINEAVAT